VAGTNACLAAKDIGLYVIDVGNPAKPDLLGSFPTTNETGGISLVGKYAYVADGIYGVKIIDLGNPAKLALAGGYSTSASAVNVHVAGRYAYVAEAIGFCPG
jgi:hypothetical protein